MDQTSRPLLAAAFMTGAMLSFTLMAVAGRELAGHLDTFEIMFYRSLIGIAIVTSVAVATGRLGELATRRFPLHLTRNISHFAGQNLWFYAVGVIPMAQLFAFEFTTPLWVALLAPLILGERFTAIRILAALIGFTGILLIARPGAITLSPGLIAAMTCALGFAGAVLTTKLLSRTETVTCILFWLTVMQAVFGLVTAGYDLDIAIPDPTSAVWVTIVGLCGLMAHFCITNALKVAPASIVGPMEFLRLPMVALVAFVLYNEPIETIVFAGAILIFAGNWLNIRTEARRHSIAA